MSARIQFNWGFHDGANAAQKHGVSFHWIDTKKVGKHYRAGWRAGFAAWKNQEQTSDSQSAWNEYRPKKNPRPRVSMSGRKQKLSRAARADYPSGFRSPARRRLNRIDPRKRKKLLRKVGFRVNPDYKPVKMNPARQYGQRLKRIAAYPMEKHEKSHAQVSASKQVFIQAQSGDAWKTIALVKDTPEMRVLAKRFAKTYKRRHPASVVRVITG